MTTGSPTAFDPAAERAERERLTAVLREIATNESADADDQVLAYVGLAIVAELRCLTAATIDAGRGR